MGCKLFGTVLKKEVHVEVEAVAPVAAVKCLSPFYGKDKILVHDGFGAYAGACVEGFFVVAVDFRQSGCLLSFFAERSDHHACVRERVDDKIPVLPEEAEMQEAQAQLGIHPCHTITDDPVAVDATQGERSSQTLGIRLSHIEGVDIRLYIKGGMSGESALVS